jgi:PAS domain S-box-containing protein
MIRTPLRLKFGGLLFGLFVSLAGLVAIIGSIGWIVSRQLVEVEETAFPQVLVADRLVQLFDAVTAETEAAVLTGDPHGMARRNSELLHLQRMLRETLDRTPSGPREELESIRTDLEQYASRSVRLAEALITYGRSTEAGPDLDPVDLEQLGKEVSRAESRVALGLRRYAEDRRKEAGAQLADAGKVIHRGFLVALVLGIATFAGLMLGVVRLARAIVPPIHALSIAAREVARGDLDREIELPKLEEDEVGDLAHAFVDMTRGLRESTVSRAYLDRVLESMVDTLIVVGPKGIIDSVNPATLTLLGYEREELIGRPFAEVVGEEAGAVADLDRIPLGRPWSAECVEVRYRGRDGRLIPVLLSGGAMLDDQGGVSGFVLVATDFTERRRVRDELARARDQAEEATRAKSDFIANMSHELRTPMNGVMGMVELLLSTELEPDQRDLAETAYDSADTLLSLINDILDLSKLEAKRVEVESVAFSVRETADEVATIMATKAEEKGLALQVVADEIALTTVVGDGMRVRQIILNLVGNAIKFTETGRVKIDLRDAEIDGDELRVRIQVVDTGCGIPAHLHDRLFRKFSQADASTTRTHGGTGLGLAISRELATLLGGRVGLESEPGEGSTFWVELRFPLDPAAAPLEEAPLTGRRAVVVARDPAVVEGTASDLRSLGAEVTLASSASIGRAEAHLAVLDEAAFAADALSAVVEKLSGRGVRVLVVAALGSRPRLVRELKDRVEAVLSRPVSWSALTAALSTPLSTPEPVVDSPDPVPVPVAASASAPGAHVHVLLAEDNKVNQKLAQRILERLGATVDVVEDGRRAVEQVEAVDYDLVLMDCQMPDMDGYTATQEIRRRGHHALPIVALTANAMKGDEERCLEAGMNDYLSKPVRIERIAEAVARWTSRESDAPPKVA